MQQVQKHKYQMVKCCSSKIISIYSPLSRCASKSGTPVHVRLLVWKKVVKLCSQLPANQSETDVWLPDKHDMDLCGNRL